MKVPKNLKPSILILLGIAALSASAGCGQAPVQPIVGSATQAGTTAPGTTTTPPGSTTPTNGSPNYDFHFELTGANLAAQVGGGTMTVTTDTVLQVVLTAGSGGVQVGGSGYTAGFNCEKFNVKVGNVSAPVFVAVAGYTDVPLMYGFTSYDPCSAAPTSWTYDFSSALGAQHGAVSIQINQAQYDNCRLQSFPNAANEGGCGLTSVYANDTVDGYIQVFTD